MNDPDSTVLWSHNGMGDGLPEQLWGYNDLTGSEEEPAADAAGGLISLAFITAALKRSKGLWCTTAVIGFLIGCGLYVKYPPAYEAATTILIQNNPSEDATQAIQTDQALAGSLAVASRAIHSLGLQQTPGSLAAATTVTFLTDNVLEIEVKAPSSEDAVQRTNALAAAFLQVRNAYLLTQQQETDTELNQQLEQARQQLASAKTSAQRSYWNVAEPQTVQYVAGTLATTNTTTNSMIKDSKVFDAAVALKHSHYKTALLYIAGGLVVGLAIGMAIVVLGALMSDRLRRRDDVAEALGASVRLSVGAMRVSRRALRLPGRGNAQGRDMGLVVAHLRRLVPGGSRHPAGLAIVAVDNERVVAPAVVSLATSCASEGGQVVLADLSGDASAARLLGVKGPGISPVSVNGVELLVAVPDKDDVAPNGPLGTSTSLPAGSKQASEPLVTACASADLLLTLAILDPAFGGDHLATWATDVVTVVTAGQSSATRIHAVGEMIRLAGARLVSVVLTGADKGDESLGVPTAPDQSTQVKLG